MKIVCRHGYFQFFEQRVGQASDFMFWSKLDLVAEKDYFTFEFLKDSPKYSLIGKTFMGLPATATFEGEPWRVFEENGFIYDFTKDLVVPILSVLNVTSIKQAGNLYVSNGLILPGSLTAEGKRVKDYSAWFSRDNFSFKYSEVGYV